MTLKPLSSSSTRLYAPWVLHFCVTHLSLAATTGPGWWSPHQCSREEDWLSTWRFWFPTSGHSRPIHDCGPAFTLSLLFPLQMEGKEIARGIVCTVPFPQPNRPTISYPQLGGSWALCAYVTRVSPPFLGWIGNPKFSLNFWTQTCRCVFWPP